MSKDKETQSLIQDLVDEQVKGSFTGGKSGSTWVMGSPDPVMLSLDKVLTQPAYVGKPMKHRGWIYTRIKKFFQLILFGLKFPKKIPKITANYKPVSKPSKFSYSTFGGCDMQIFIDKKMCTAIQAISYAESVDLSEKELNKREAGKCGAGSLILINFVDDPLIEALGKDAYDTSIPHEIMVYGANEYGSQNMMILSGVRFVNNGWGCSRG